MHGIGMHDDDQWWTVTADTTGAGSLLADSPLRTLSGLDIVECDDDDGQRVMCYHRGPPSSGIRDAVAAVLGVDWRPMTVAELDPNAERAVPLGPMRGYWGISYDTERRTGKRAGVRCRGVWGRCSSDNCDARSANHVTIVVRSVSDRSGCGTGVLGLLALQRGASRVSFTDVDNR